MNARSNLYPTLGKEKAKIVWRSLLSPVTPEVSASVLQLPPDVAVLLDQEVAKELTQQKPDSAWVLNPSPPKRNAIRLKESSA
ncbi:hypothetical protein DRN74_06905 [Candidatus Micrarchaeota archaeon]|nr:MAG: hypothetical protein DRN74_06905 [Candidatus Micrarchaeota archaeon]